MVNVNLVGHLGADAEIKKTKDGNDFLSFRVAVNEFVNGQRVTTWFNVSMFELGRMQNMIPYLKKGSSVLVNGSETCRIYQNQSGENIIARDIRAYNIEFASSGKQENNNTTTTTTTTSTVTTAQTPQAVPSATVATANCGTFNQPQEIVNDLPF